MPETPVPHILLVDDDEAFLYSSARALEDEGFRVTSCLDYRTALPVLTGDLPVDLLIVDLVMPHAVNGFALARMALMRRPQLKVIYVTGFHDVPTGEAAGPILPKPLAAAELVAAARQALTPGQ